MHRWRQYATAALVACALLLLGPAALSAAQQTARGVVFHDQNRNGIRDAGEPGIRGVRVSNQRDVVATDSEGRYALPVTDDSIVFVIKPSGWTPPLTTERVKRFYTIHKPAGSPPLRYAGVAPTGPLPASIDFPLTPQREPRRFRVLVFGDTQPRNQEEVDFIAHDVVADLIGSDAAFGMSLGDVVFDDLTVFENLKRTKALIGIPWVYVHGNHDTNMDAPEDRLSDETWERYFGPNYYAFDWGRVHFVVLDNIHWIARTETTRARYVSRLGAEQLAFVRNSLAHVPKDRLVVLLMHIPIMGTEDREELFRLLEDRPRTVSFSAHWHTQEHRFLGSDDGWRGRTPHHHFIAATVSGSWWSGAPDERGIPHATMSDGAPNGHSVVTFDGDRYSIVFRAASRPASYQMNIYTPSEVAAAESATTEVLANVFAGSPRCQVEMRIGGGTWLPMERVLRPDPAFVEMKRLEAGPRPPPGRALPVPQRSSHLWMARLPAGIEPGTHVVTVRTTDQFGARHEGKRVFRVR